MKKTLFILSFAFLSLPTFASAADVATFDELKAALSDVSTTTITITTDISTPEKLLINRPLTIIGGGHTVSFSPSNAGWNGNYVFHVYGTSDVTISDIKLTAGDAGLLVNNSTVTLTGSIDVSGNEFGGIESSNGSVLTVSGATLTNSTESYRLPTAWEDGMTGNTVVGFVGATSTPASTTQIQYYLNTSSLTTVTTSAYLQALLSDAAVSTINIMGTIGLTAQLTINRAVEFVGLGSNAGLVATTDFGSTNGSKHLVGVQGVPTGTVSFSNLTLNSDAKAYGVHAYTTTDPADVRFSNVTMKNSKGAGLTVNGSTVVATNLTTEGNVWGSVNVDPGSGVLSPSVFTLNSGTLATTTTQIWSDGAHVTPTASVTVSASGYTQYTKAGTNVVVWSNNIVNLATITKAGVTTGYTTIQAAIDAAESGDTVIVYPGTYNETAMNRSVNGGSYQFGLFFGTSTVTLQAASTGVIVKTNATNSFGKSGTFVAADNITISGIEFAENIPGTNKTIEVIGDNFTLTNSKISETNGSVYISDFTAVNLVNKFTITNNVFDNASTISIASGAGSAASSPNTDRVITGNTFKSSTVNAARISFTGTGGQGWFLYPVGGAVITGNTFEGENKWHIRARGDYANAQFNWKSIWENNTFIKGSMALSDLDTFTVREYSYTPYTNVRSISGDLAWTKSNASSTDTILLKGYSEVPATVQTTPEAKTATIESDTQLTASTTQGTISVLISEGTVISGPTTWDGTFDLPTATTTYTIPSESNGSYLTPTGAVAIGAGDTHLTFDQAIKLTFAGQAGKLAGWSQNGVFAKISTTCDSATNPTLTAGTDCKIDVGADLVVWTKHATTFITYTEAAIPYGGGGGYSSGSGSTGGSVLGASTTTVTVATTTPGIIVTAVPTTPGMVLGATAVNFSRNLGYGANGDDVTELQKMLMTNGYLKINVATKWFGPLTKSALIKWQAKNGIPATGFFGTISRGFVAK